jgi:RNA polymerase sigma-B factor
VGVGDIVDALDVRANQTAGSLDGVDPVLGVALAEQIGSADANLEKVEYQHALRPLLDALPERERTILTLRFFGEMTQTQIGQRLGISQMHVSRILARTLKQLRVALTAED